VLEGCETEARSSRPRAQCCASPLQMLYSCMQHQVTFGAHPSRLTAVTHQHRRLDSRVPVGMGVHEDHLLHGLNGHVPVRRDLHLERVTARSEGRVLGGRW
jgi:hypothetical protein